MHKLAALCLRRTVFVLQGAPARSNVLCKCWSRLHPPCTFSHWRGLSHLSIMHCFTLHAM